MIGFYNMAKQVVERTAQSDNKITWATIKEQLGDSIHHLTRMKFQVRVIKMVTVLLIIMLACRIITLMVREE